MKVHEYQAKELLAAAGANVPKHIVCKTPDDVAAAFDKLANGGGVMVKYVRYLFYCLTRESTP